MVNMQKVVKSGCRRAIFLIGKRNQSAVEPHCLLSIVPRANYIHTLSAENVDLLKLPIVLQITSQLSMSPNAPIFP